MLDTAVVILLALVVCASAAIAEIDPAKHVNVSRFGYAWFSHSGEAKPVYAPEITDAKVATTRELAAGQSLTVEWVEPRDISNVIVRGPSLPDPKDLELQYWYCIWPDNGSGGWARVDDPYNGSWVTVKANVSAKSGQIAYTFAPLEKDENPKVTKTGDGCRRTYRLRLMAKAPAVISELESYTGSVWKTAEIKMEWAPKSKKPVLWKGTVGAANAEIISVKEQKKPGDPAVIKVRYSDSPFRLSTDRGFVTFRTAGWKSFSVFVDDVVSKGGIYVRDIDAFVSDSSKKLTFAKWTGPAGAWDGTVMEKVAEMPEQSLERVMKAIPAKDPREAPLGVPNMRQEFTIDNWGNVQCWRASLRCPGTDLDRRPWKIHALAYTMSTSEKPVFTDDGGRKVTRSLEDGWLPVIHSEWATESIKYHQQAYATMLLEKIGDRDSERRGDEPLVLLDKLEITNSGKSAAKAHLWIELSLKASLTIAKDGMLMLDHPTDGVDRPGLAPMRGKFDTNGKGELTLVNDCVPAKPGSPDPELKDSDAPRWALHYTVDLAPGETHAIYMTVPYVECLTKDEIAAIKASRYEDRHAEVVDYWRKRYAAGMQYEVPEPWLNDLWRSNLWHALITTDRDPKTGLYEHFAATVGYNNYINETSMVAQSLEMRGEHLEAWRMLEPYAVCQGVKPLPGNFKSKDGLLYAAYPDAEHDSYTAQGYNMHHGWGLWKLAEHYKYTKDKTYLKSIAQKLIDGCDWVTRERQATKIKHPDGTKVAYWGLAPAGDLEDVEEYLYWYATNAYYYVGMLTAAEVLVEIKHPEAARIAKDTEAFRKDLLASVKESTATSPVVELKDGTYIPFVPPRTDVITHLKEGWIREGLYPALHLLDGELYTPDHPYITWILEDLEDNVFLSKESGYGVEDQAGKFFDLGGFNPQPNLLPNPMAHLRRDEPSHFVRTFYNFFWASFFPDTVNFCEWVPGYGKSGGPMYKTPDESKFVQYMRCMLAFEEGDTLKLGIGVPRAWMADGKTVRIERAATFFGPMDMTVTSHVARGHIDAKIALPTRNPAAHAVLRLRHPEAKRMKQVTVNGKEWKQFDAKRDLITLPEKAKSVEVVAYY